MRRKWTHEENEYMRQNYPNTETVEIAIKLDRSVNAVYHQAQDNLGLHKSPEFKASLFVAAGARAKIAGMATRIKVGSIPWNKGKKNPSTGRAKETQFKPGNRPWSWKPVGSRRVSKEGYLEEKVSEPRGYAFVHHLVWIAAGNPPVPKSHALVFRDGDKSNLAVENLELITRAELMQRNSYHNYGPEMSRVVQLRGAISRQIKRRSRCELGGENQKWNP